MANAIVEKSEAYAVRIVNLYKFLKFTRYEYVMSKQILRCGTSIGANIAEAQEAQTDYDFLAKLYIALKECSESLYWQRILFRTEFLEKSEFHSLQNDALEIKALLTSIIKTKKLKMTESKQ
ncbi:MAG: four helix bundle protein [Duncaniella sp.]|nr:four helix bundle protein [Duncaniella sp.]